MIKIERAEEPEILKTKGKQARKALCTSYEQGKTEFSKEDFNDNIYAHPSVKKALFSMQNGKCFFCEIKTKQPQHPDKGDVEHFRPKNGYQQDKDDDLHKPGYYWLAYEWTNLLWSCATCNRSYKKNLFPLQNPTARAKNHSNDITSEIPLLINPSEQNPKDYIKFNRSFIYALDDNPYGKATIELLSLNREDLEEARRAKLKTFKQQLVLIKAAATYTDDYDLQKASREAQQMIQEMALPQAEYSAMIKAALSKTLQ